MKCSILHNALIKGRYYLCELSAPSICKKAQAGQFIHVRMEDSCDPLLRRPLSIHEAKGGRLKILYEVAGKGTALLAGKKPNAELDVLGPLGSGFNIKKLASYSKIYIVAGGMGVAPLFFLAKRLTEVRSRKSEIGKPVILIGARTKDQVLGEKEFKKLGCEVKIATEDGSRGFKGRVTGLLEELLAAGCKPSLDCARDSRWSQAASKKTKKPGAGSLEPEAVICACGPKPMLAAIAKIAHDRRVSAQVSLEEFMGCGLGACLGCVIRTTSGYKRICHDGPVFDAREIVWEK